MVAISLLTIILTSTLIMATEVLLDFGGTIPSTVRLAIIPDTVSASVGIDGIVGIVGEVTTLNTTAILEEVITQLR